MCCQRWRCARVTVKIKKKEPDWALSFCGGSKGNTPPCHSERSRTFSPLAGKKRRACEAESRRTLCETFACAMPHGMPTRPRAAGTLCALRKVRLRYRFAQGDTIGRSKGLRIAGLRGAAPYGFGECALPYFLGGRQTAPYEGEAHIKKREPRFSLFCYIQNTITEITSRRMRRRRGNSSRGRGGGTYGRQARGPRPACRNGGHRGGRARPPPYQGRRG